MQKKILVQNENNPLLLNEVPVECPYCHISQIPTIYCGARFKSSHFVLFCRCTNSECRIPFNISYDQNKLEFSSIKQGKLIRREFADEIKGISDQFSSIYNEAFAAEQMDLDQITGAGYRKALEFLIKDYLIYLRPENAENIKTKLLGNCINDDVDDSRIKEVAKRAAWLGNDETHYVRKWVSKDVSHLKAMIDLCIHWIEAEITTKKMIEEMP